MDAQKEMQQEGVRIMSETTDLDPEKCQRVFTRLALRLVEAVSEMRLEEAEELARSVYKGIMGYRFLTSTALQDVDGEK